MTMPTLSQKRLIAVQNNAYFDRSHMRKIGLAPKHACLLISLRNQVDLHDWLTDAQIRPSANILIKKRLMVEARDHTSGYQLTEAGVQAAIAAEYVGWQLELAAREEWWQIQAEMDVE